MSRNSLPEQKMHPDLERVLEGERIFALAVSVPVAIVGLLLFSDFLRDDSPLFSPLGVLFLSGFVTVFSFMIWVLLVGYPGYYRRISGIVETQAACNLFIQRIGKRTDRRRRHRYSFVISREQKRQAAGDRYNIIPTTNTVELESIYTRTGGWPFAQPVPIKSYLDPKTGNPVAFEFKGEIFWVRPDLQMILS